MLSRIAKGALLGVGAGIVGSIASLTPFGLKLEENFGLEILFHLRGERSPPPEVVVVSIDKESSDRLDLPNTEKKFPRSLHADLTEKLSKRGAAVIAFDLFFEDSGKDGHFGNRVPPSGHASRVKGGGGDEIPQATQGDETDSRSNLPWHIP